MSETRKQARIAGLWYLLLGVTAPIGLMYVPGKLFVRGDATATADNIRASEWLLRVGVASELIHQLIGVFLILALYRLFKAVDQRQATLMALFSLLGLPVVFLNVLNEIAALILVSGADFLAVFDKRQLDALVLLFIRLHGQGINVASIFWGLWLFPFAVLVLRSGFIPRFLGVLMMIAGVGYLASAFTTLLLPQYSRSVDQIALLLEFGELPIMFWLLIWGAKEQRPGAPALSSGEPEQPTP